MKIIFKNEPDWKGSIKYYVASFSYNDTNILNFDREGRVISFISDNGTERKITYKKGFDGTWLGIKRVSGRDPRVRFHLTEDQVHNLYLKIVLFAEKLINLLQQPESLEFFFDPQDVYNKDQIDNILSNWIKIIKKVSLKQNKKDKANFPSIYSNVGILPPDRYGSLVIQVTTGCIYNKCSFCTLYEGISYSYKKPEELKQHLQDILGFMGDSIGRFHSLFIGDANALTIPYTDLSEIFTILNEAFFISDSKISYLKKNKPIFEGIYSFLDVFTGFKITADQFNKLALKKLKMVYLGIETGSHKVLQILNKPNTTSKILKIINSLHEASIGVAVIFLIGAGGKMLEEEHVTESIMLIKQMNLTSNDIIYLSKLFIYKGYQKIIEEKNIKSLSDKELENQFKIFKQELEKYYLTQNSKPIITRYELLDFVY